VTLIYEFHLDKVKMKRKHHTEYLRHLYENYHLDTSHTHTTDQLLYMTTTVIGNKQNVARVSSDLTELG